MIVQAGVKPVRCDNPKHPEGCPFGSRLIDCDEDDALWWLATVCIGSFCRWSQKFGSREQANAALVERMSKGFAA